MGLRGNRGKGAHPPAWDPSPRAMASFPASPYRAGPTQHHPHTESGPGGREQRRRPWGLSAANRREIRAARRSGALMAWAFLRLYHFRSKSQVRERGRRVRGEW